ASRVYEVKPTDLVLAHPAQVRYSIGDETGDLEARIAVVEGDRAEPIASVLETGTGWVRAEIEDLSASRFAALLRSNVPCDPAGWDAPPAAGRAFVINNLAIAANGRGFDVDGACDTSGSGCIDNALHRLGDLWNDQLRQGQLGGGLLSLVELA